MMVGLERLTDENLVERAREGDTSAFRVLADRHSRLLRWRIRRRLVPGMYRKVDAEDVLQEALLVAYRRVPEFEDRGVH